jgi:hypothetical protein
MPTLTQSQLQRHVEILINNGRLNQAQAAISGVGYGPAALDTGQILLQTWLTRQQQAQTLLIAQKRATETEVQAGQAAQAEITDLSQTVRTLFSQDAVTLTSLGLRPRQRNGNGHAHNGNGEAENGHSQRSSASRSMADKIAQWRRMLVSVQAFSQAQQVRLAEAGWNSERLAQAANLVEAFAGANTYQKEQMQLYRTELTAAQEAEAAVRQWFKEASRLSRLAIRRTSRANEAELRQLLGV